MPFAIVTDPDQSDLIQLAYKSRARSDLLPSETRDILRTARRQNAKRDVTGLLLHDGRRFLQILEGTLDDVTATYRAIAADDRHSGITLLLHRSVETRDFRDWRMGFYTWRANTGNAGPAFFYDEDVVSHLPPHCSPVAWSIVAGFVGGAPSGERLLQVS